MSAPEHEHAHTHDNGEVHEHAHTHANGEVHYGSHDHAHSHEAAETGTNPGAAKTNKATLKTLAGLGLKPVKGISRVTFKLANYRVIAINAPEVYVTPAGKYVVLGDSQVEDISGFGRSLGGAAPDQDVGAAAKNAAAVEGADKPAIDAAAAASADDEEDVEVDEDELKELGLSLEDLSLIKEQTEIKSTKKIADAFKNNGKDVVNTIISLQKV